MHIYLNYGHHTTNFRTRPLTQQDEATGANYTDDTIIPPPTAPVCPHHPHSCCSLFSVDNGQQLEPPMDTVLRYIPLHYYHYYTLHTHTQLLMYVQRLSYDESVDVTRILAASAQSLFPATTGIVSLAPEGVLRMWCTSICSLWVGGNPSLLNPLGVVTHPLGPALGYGHSQKGGV